MINQDDRHTAELFRNFVFSHLRDIGMSSKAEVAYMFAVNLILGDEGKEKAAKGDIQRISHYMDDPKEFHKDVMKKLSQLASEGSDVVKGVSLKDETFSVYLASELNTAIGQFAANTVRVMVSKDLRECLFSNVDEAMKFVARLENIPTIALSGEEGDGFQASAKVRGVTSAKDFDTLKAALQEHGYAVNHNLDGKYVVS
jgi:hypothetical protein